MSPVFRVREKARDDTLGIISKEIRLSSSVSITTPTKSLKQYGNRKITQADVLEINNLFRERQLTTLYEGGGRKRISKVENRILKNALNLVIFDLQVNRIPSKEQIRILTHHLVQVSEKCIFLPTVKTSILKEKKIVIGPRTGQPQEKWVWSDRNFNNYKNMMSFIIDEIELFGNRKEIFGTIPLMIPKYSKSLIDLYTEKGIGSYAIDANHRNILGKTNLSHLSFTLSTLNDFKPLNESLIYACNLGIQRFSRGTARADDFLGLFTYIDVLGSVFKPRYIPKPPTEPTVKLFNRKGYSYDLLGTFTEASRMLRRTIDRNYVKSYNQNEQLREAQELQRKIGREKMSMYIRTKNSIDDLIHERLRDLVRKIRHFKKMIL